MMSAPVIRNRTMRLPGMEVDYLDAGSGPGPLIMFLHGFPDHAHNWRWMLSCFAEAGYHAVAPTMRGYSVANAAPNGVYRDWATGQDALALIEALGYEQAILVGHDWGAAAAYAAAQIQPSRLQALVTLAVPFGRALRDALLHDGDQQRRSWYWYFFQLPIARDAVALEEFAFLDRLWAEWSPGFRLPKDSVRLLKSTFAQPGVLEEVLKYYHQLFQPAPCAPPQSVQERLSGRISVPTLYLHGRRDGCIGADVGADTAHLFDGVYQRLILEDAGHFLHLEQPQAVFDAITTFLKQSEREGAT